MAGGLFGRPFELNVKCIIFSMIIMTLFLIENRNKDNIKRLYITLCCFGLISLFSGLLLRNYFVLNKNLGTPTWILISLSTAVFLFISNCSLAINIKIITINIK